jgi:hypothetical protein
VILLGLKILNIGHIVRTIVVEPTVNGVLVLGIVVLIRIVLSFTPRLRSTAVGRGPRRLALLRSRRTARPSG